MFEAAKGQFRESLRWKVAYKNLALLDLRGLTRKNDPTPPNRAKDVETKLILF
jgi:hypothetical protein